MKDSRTECVKAISEINLEGNIVPHIWFSRILRDTGKPDSIAILILADIMYWYKQTVIRDEGTGAPVEYRKKFRKDKLQRNYDQLSKQFGFSKVQVRDAVKRLEASGLLTIELRNEKINGLSLSNVMYLEPIPQAVWEISRNDPSSENSSHPPINFSTPPNKNLGTYTETTAETTAETTESDAYQRYAESDFQSQEAAESKNEVSGMTVNQKNNSNSGSQKKSRHSRKQRLDPMLELWNSFPETATHKPGTKLVSRLNRKFAELREGTFFRTRELEPGWCENSGLRTKDIAGGWSDSQLKRALRKLRNLYREDHEPENKDWLKKMNLESLLYNPRSQKSMLLKYFHYPPRKLSDIAEQKEKEALSGSAEKIHDRILREFRSDIDAGQIESSAKVREELKDIARKLGWTWDNRKQAIWQNWYFDYPERLAEEYCNGFRDAYPGWKGWEVSALRGAKLRRVLEKRVPGLFKYVFGEKKTEPEN